jgi:hypothetical protein
MPFYPEVLQAKECAPTLSPFIVFTFGLAIESIKELRGASMGLVHIVMIIFTL